MTTFSTLSADERAKLSCWERIDIGKYHTWNPVRECAFVVELNANPLVELAEAAALGRRVYEFMSIRRPGDVLRYLTVHLADVDEEVLATVTGWMQKQLDGSQPELPFVELDSCFHWDYDDTPPHESAWLAHRQGAYWPAMMSEVFEVVRRAQSRLRQSDDYLLMHELKLIDACRHPRDFWADWRYDVHPVPIGVGKPIPVPEAVRAAILELIRRDDVRSVSCPFDDYQLWRALVAEQLRRSEATGQPLQRAFALCGPDSGLPGIEIKDWGGEVHIPQEGACGSDLFIVPSWHRFFADKVRDGGKLRWSVSKPCNHVLVHGDFGELGCATRKTFDEWTLYSSTAPHEDCNPIFDTEFERIKAQAAMVEKPGTEHS